MRWTLCAIVGASVTACGGPAYLDPSQDPGGGGQHVDAGPAKLDAGASRVDAGKGLRDGGGAANDASMPPPGPDSGGGGQDAQPPPPMDSSVGPMPCKRGIASNDVPINALAAGVANPGINWWYDWGTNPSGGAPTGIEFVPMVWGTAQMNGPIAGNASYLLGFNEPNFANQSNMTPSQAAQNWPKVEALAKAQGIPIVSPGLNFCGSASDPSNCSDPSVTDPYTWLKQFFAQCPGCEVDYLAIHWYNCDLPSLQAYIEGNSTLEGFVQFGKPIWLTEFCCDNSNSPAQQKTYMQQAIPYLEGNPHVVRYSWFSATNIPNALLQSNGALTDLGQTYATLPQACP